MLLLLFDAAKWRLMAASGKIALLSDESIAAATEAMARISDDIRDATIRLSAQDDAALHPSKPTKDLEVQPAASAIPKRAAANAPDRPQRPKEIASSRSTVLADGVQLDEEYGPLAVKAAFISQLVTLGYSPHEFRVTVRCFTSEGPGGRRKRYTVMVAQLLNDVPIREKQYVGGQDADWINKSSRDAVVDFPRKLDVDAQTTPVVSHQPPP